MLTPYGVYVVRGTHFIIQKATKGEHVPDIILRTQCLLHLKVISRYVLAARS